MSEEEITRLWEKQFSILRLARVRNIFLFCCYTGLAYADVRKLESSQIKRGIDGKYRLFTDRPKTKTAAQHFGFAHNPYVVVRHRDKPHEHFHIVASRIHESGKTTVSDKHSFRQANAFCRKMEQEFKLTPVSEQKQRLGKKEILQTSIAVDSNTRQKPGLSQAMTPPKEATLPKQLRKRLKI